MLARGFRSTHLNSIDPLSVAGRTGAWPWPRVRWSPGSQLRSYARLRRSGSQEQASAGPAPASPLPRGRYLEGGSGGSLKDRYACNKCGKVYSHRESLARHNRFECAEAGKVPQFQCPHCPHRAKQRSNLVRHMRGVHPDFLSMPEPDGPVEQLELVAEDSVLEVELL